MNIAILICLVSGFFLFIWAWLIHDDDPDLQQIPLFILGMLCVLIGIALFTARLIFRFFTGS
jgi:uncharacterized membrane protein YczE